ncbi:MAG: oxygen-independent coproporphyrinogen III oxidase [Hyphomicrobiales bacterium]|nr:oxygen-independent coproporphyrinogen III oxidase [Hyphomicrobiales bacterium]
MSTVQVSVESAESAGPDAAQLIARYDGRVPRYTSYPTAPHFTPAIGRSVYARWLAELPADASVSLYLHVPFCDRLCLYCGCNTSVVRLESSHRAYAAVLMREIDRVAMLIGRRATVSHVHWGGGTPTSLPADRLIAIMDKLKERFAFARGAEIAIEIDPTSLPPDRRDALGPMGVTRVSLGVQDLEPGVQKAIGREQSYEETRACADAARALGVSSLNLDLIYGLPLQTSEGVARTARRALDLEADRVAVFGYAHVPWMKRHQTLIPEETLPGPAERFAQLNAIHRVLTHEGGYVAVGLDHYALPSDSMARAATAGRLKRSFQGYTTDTAPALIGFGASSIGSLPQGYVQNAPTAAAYAREIETAQLATVRGVALTADDRLRRDVIDRVMCDLEVDLDAVAGECSADPAQLKVAASEGMARFVCDGLASWDGRRIVVSERGRPFVRSIAALFDAYLSQPSDKPRHSRAV